MARASAPDPASAATRKCGTASRRARRPSGTSGWSSTSMMWTGLIGVSVVMVPMVQVDARAHRGARRRRSDAERAADRIQPLHHVAQADAALRMHGHVLGVEAGAV